MTDILVRNVDPELLQRLKDRAALHNRSLQGEVTAILEEAAAYATVEEATREADAIRASFGEQRFSDSAGLIREDRAR